MDIPISLLWLSFAFRTVNYVSAPQLLFFVLQTVMAAFYEKDAEIYGEEETLIIQTRCQKNLKKRRELSCDEGSREGAS